MAEARRTLTRTRLALALVVLLVAIAIGVTSRARDGEGGGPDAPAAQPPPAAKHVPGGSARVAVSTPPEMADPGVGGATLRQLTLPCLFVARPDGTWEASLVEPGSDETADDRRSATFRLRRDATWSDGTPISVEDLERTKDARFVDRVARANDDITVTFTQELPGWRRLWSGDDAIRPPRTDLYGGAYVVASLVSGLETVLQRNTTWYGDDALPYLDEVRLVYVPDAVTQRQLLAANEVDVVTPVADTVRTAQYERIDGATVKSADAGGRWTLLQANVANLSLDARRALLAAFPRREFVGSLLANEAVVVDGLLPDDTTFATPTAPVEANALAATNPTASIGVEDPFANLLTRAWQRGARAHGGGMQSRITDGAAVDRLVQANTYDLAFQSVQDGPVVCWRCRWESVDAGLATRADAGDREAALALERRLRDDAIVLPLWRPRTVVAYRTAAVGGVEPNGYAAGVAWDADRWFRP